MAKAGSDHYRDERLKKAAALRELGRDPFGVTWHPTHSVQAARALVPEAGEDDPQPRGQVVRVAGRLGNIRKAGGKLRFATIYDRSRGDAWLAQRAAGAGDLDAPERKKQRGLQLFLKRDALDPDTWEAVRNLNLADWVGVVGQVGLTQTGEPSIFVEELTVLGKSLLPPPQQAGASSGELSPEVRQRQRYLDLMMSDATLAAFLLRSRLITELRRFFTERDFLEVETPMLHPVLGGAAARPFATHHNALDVDLYLRIAPELYLKRLIVGGMERVFEINRSFRNEGIDTRHNPEFTMLEWYQAYSDHEELMDLTEELLRRLADRLLGTRRLDFAGHSIDLDRPFRRLAYHAALGELAGLDYHDRDAVTARARELDLDPDVFPTYDRLANAVWEELVEPHLVQPIFITDQPAWLTPLCRTHADRPELTRRFELFIANMEIGNAYSELNDPDLQRERFTAQLTEAEAAGDDEAGVADGRIDEDYCLALDHGLPATGGEGLGVDRLAMLFSGRENIREVILFPTMKDR